MSAVTSDTLPVATYRERLVEGIKSYDTFIIIGETACGKSTQVPQYILQENINHGKTIAVTQFIHRGFTKPNSKVDTAPCNIFQPRRLAAISLAERVAAERGERVGEVVGFKVRFDKCLSNDTLIQYMTDGMLLREAMLDKTLSKYSVIVLDEVHERSLNSDTLMGVFKYAQEERNTSKNQHKSLKLVFMSATLDLDLLLTQFPMANAVFVAGRQHKVDSFSILAPKGDHVSGIISQIISLHETLPLDHHILAFLPGQDEITSIVSLMKTSAIPKLEVLPLYSALSHKSQMRAITNPKHGVRRAVISTNLAETSLTIPGIRVVLDSGYVKRNLMNNLGLECLKLVRISKAEAYQRTGRAGRESSGTCYRFYTNDEFHHFSLFPQSEILRSNISGVILQLLKMGIKYPSKFYWLEPPTKFNLDSAIKELKDLGAIKTSTEPLEITGSGERMAGLPMAPKYAKLLLNSLSSNLLDPVSTILGAVSSENIFLECNTAVEINRCRFYSVYGDLMTYYTLLKEFCRSKEKVAFCHSNKLNLRALKYAVKVRQQLIDYIRNIVGDVNLHYDTRTLRNDLRKFFLEAMPMNVATLEGDVYKTRRGNSGMIEVKIHPTSVMAGKTHPKLHYLELVQLSGGITYMSHISYCD